MWLGATEGVRASCRRRDAPLATRGTAVGLRLFVHESYFFHIGSCSVAKSHVLTSGSETLDRNLVGAAERVPLTEDGEIVTYDPCPHGLDDDNYPPRKHR